MKRSLAIVAVSAAGAIVFAVLVHGVLVAVHRSDAAATTVHGVTPRRVWATTAVMVGLAGVGAASVALVRGARGIGNRGRNGAIVAVASGILSAVNGGANLAVASGGPGSGNGVVGGAAAFVLGVIAIGLGGVALSRSRRAELKSGPVV